MARGRYKQARAQIESESGVKPLRKQASSSRATTLLGRPVKEKGQRYFER